MRTIVGVTLLCISATSAFSHGAVAVGRTALGPLYGVATNQPTQESAMRAAESACNAASPSGENVIQQCNAGGLFKNRCVAIITGGIDPQRIIFGVTGADPQEAEQTGTLLCNHNRQLPLAGTCRTLDQQCDTIEMGTAARVDLWWTSQVTASSLVVAGAFFFLIIALAFIFFRMRRLQRTLAGRVTPDIYEVPTTAAKRARKINEPIDEPPMEPALDTRAIKEAFKPTKRRDEFEL